MKPHKSDYRFPAVPYWIFSKLLTGYSKLSVLGDLEEEFSVLCREEGEKKARKWTWRQAIKSLPFLVKSLIYWSVTMFYNYLINAFRNMMKHKGYSFLNILGLSLGLAACIMIFSYIRFDLSFDRHLDRAESIYRVTVEESYGGSESWRAMGCAPIGRTFPDRFPEIEKGVRLLNKELMGQTVVEYNGKQYREKKFLYADPSFFDVFSFRLEQGSEQNALSRPNTVVISATMARKYFGSRDPLGKTITVDHGEQYEITGVMQDIPANTHFDCDFVASISSVPWVKRKGWDSSWCFYTYFLVKEPGAVSSLQKKIDRYVQEDLGYADKTGESLHLHLQPVTDIHLYSHLEHELGVNGDIEYIYIFSTIALFILLIACINYINMNTVHASSRAREIGIRKVTGAGRGQLFLQFLGESVVYTFISLVAAIALVEFLGPLITSLSSSPVSLTSFWKSGNLLLLVGGTLFISLLNGIFPAIILSSFQPVRALKFNLLSQDSGSRLRKSLVIVQFVISMGMIAGTLMIDRQLDYIQGKKLGYDKENVIALPIGGDEVSKMYRTVKNEMVKNNSILDVSTVSEMPCNIVMAESYEVEGFSALDGTLFKNISVDKDFLRTMKMEMAEGTWFLGSDTGKHENVYILNEAAVKKFDWRDKSVLGVNIRHKDGILGKGPIIGVVKDFHFASLHSPIEPLVIYISPRHYRFVLARISGVDIPRTLSYLREVWKTLLPGVPFQYSFLDRELDGLYRSEKRLGNLFGIFSLLAIGISCMGLFSLFSFIIVRRTKEIGIRKVLGASVWRIVMLLIRDSVRLVVSGILISAGLSLYFINLWLKGFVYRSGMDLGIFLFAGLITLFPALLIMVLQAVKASAANPVEVLKYE